MNPLVHIRQKKKFAQEIEAEIASGNIRHESTRSHPSEEEIRTRNRSRNCKWKHCHESTRSHPSEEEIRKRNRSRNCKWKHSS